MNMKTINETFTESEYDALKEVKDGQSWHDFIMLLQFLKREGKRIFLEVTEA